MRTLTVMICLALFLAACGSQPLGLPTLKVDPTETLTPIPPTETPAPTATSTATPIPGIPAEQLAGMTPAERLAVAREMFGWASGVQPVEIADGVYRVTIGTGDTAEQRYYDLQSGGEIPGLDNAAVAEMSAENPENVFVFGGKVFRYDAATEQWADETGNIRGGMVELFNNPNEVRFYWMIEAGRLELMYSTYVPGWYDAWSRNGGISAEEGGLFVEWYTQQVQDADVYASLQAGASLRVLAGEVGDYPFPSTGGVGVRFADIGGQRIVFEEFANEVGYRNGYHLSAFVQEDGAVMVSAFYPSELYPRTREVKGNMLYIGVYFANQLVAGTQDREVRSLSSLQWPQVVFDDAVSRLYQYGLDFVLADN